MSAEPIGILGLGLALASIIVTPTMWMGRWIRDLAKRVAILDQGMERVEGLLHGAALFQQREPAL